MNGFITFCIIILISYCTISWILPKLLAWLFQRKYNITLRIGRIGIPYLRLCDVHILKNGISVHVDEIGFRSSFLNSEVTKLVTLVVRDVRINKDIGNKKCKREETNKLIQQNELDFRNKKVPPFITTFAQFMAVHIYNISAMLLRAETPGCLIHVTASELHLDGSVVQNARTLLVNVTLTEAKVKVLRHAESKHDNLETCLAELNFAITMEATLVAQGPLSVEKLHIGMQKTSAVINEGFYSFVQERKTNNKIECIEKKSSPNIYHRIAPIIPKNFTFNFEETSLRSLKNNSRTDFVSTLQTLIVNIRFNSYAHYNVHGNENLPQIYFAFQIINFSIRSNKEEFLILRTLSIDAKLENNIVNLYLKLNTLSICYNHAMIHSWIHSNFLQNKLLKSFNSEQEMSTLNEITWFENLANLCIIKGCVELWHVSALLRLSENEETNSSVGFDHTKLILDQLFETRSSQCTSSLPRVILSNRHWTLDLLIESLWWHLSSHEPDTTILKKQHPWGTPLFLGVALMKIGSHGNKEIKMDAMLDSMQCEWSPALAKFLLQTFKCINEYKIPNNKINNSVKSKTENDGQILMNLSLSNFNCFFITENNVFIVTRLNSINLERTAKKTVTTINGLKMTSIEPNKSYYTCIRAEDIKNYCGFIKVARIDNNNNNQNIKDTNIQLLDEVLFNWSTNLHLKLLTLLNEINEFKTHLNSFLNLNTSPKDASGVSKNTTVQFSGKVGLFIKISENHNMRVSFDDLTIQSTNSNLNIQNVTTNIAIDNSNIFTIDGLKLSRILDSEEIREERYNSEGFSLPWNKTWGITINLLKASFPYKHEYAEAVQNELISVFKWLKIVHKRSKKSFTADSPLPSDLCIVIGEFLFEMSDDPFEVRLRDNYELLEDEYKESLKRQKMLDSKVSELCKTHLHLPAGKVEELYASLNKKNAEIYVQRSKQMYRAVPMRTRLFAWCMNNIKIMALADPSIHGTDNVVKTMKDIDSDSPWPEEGLEFITLWCRSVSMACKEWKFLLRDFPQPLLDISCLHLWGRLVGAEQEAPRRAKRGVTLELGEPWGSILIERGMIPLKFYHDFNCEIQHYSYAFGPCWEPVIAQCNLIFEKISAPSRDPSPPLSFWDKMRLLFHGRLTMCINQLTVLLHASLDPYNTTEEMELTWSDVAMDWTNAKFVYKGDLNVYVRTASKYDDCRLLHLPNLKLTIKLDWVCLADPNDHHSVIPCAPDKLPEYSSNQEHDSFRAFRSQNINISIALETKNIPNQSPNEFDYPTLLLYGSTLRWIENLKLILSGVTRPTRRGKIFKNVRPRKIQLSRHYRKVHLSLALHRFQICYWMSFAMQRGFELLGGRLSSSSVPTYPSATRRENEEMRTNHVCISKITKDRENNICTQHDLKVSLLGLKASKARLRLALEYACSPSKVSLSEHTLALVPIDDGLKHRPRAEWSIMYMNCDLTEAEIWLQSALQEETSETEVMSLRQPVEKCYCLSVGKVSYGRETVLFARGEHTSSDRTTHSSKDTPTHRLVVYDLKGAWTKSNRNVAFALFDTFMKTKQLKKNLSTEGLKGFRCETNSTPLKSRRNVDPSTTPTPPGIQVAQAASAVQGAPSPSSKLQSGLAVTMLQQLIAEAENKNVVFSDDLSSATRQQHLKGLQACQEDDVQHKNWLIALVNSQVLLKGCETKGYVILSAAKAEILQRVHRPVWKDHTLVSKTTWVGSLECLQYYATVSAGENDSLDENIMWLTVDNIQEKDSTVIADLPDVPDLVGSGQSVGGVVSETVGASSIGENPPIQLQRIVSRCKCEFFYVGYGDSSIDPGAVGEVPPPPQEDVGPWDRQETAVDAFTLMHHDLDVCTNSLQYAMLLDVVNNLLLYVEPHRKKALERLARMRFQLQLHSIEDQKRPIQNLQNQVRCLVSKIRRLEKDWHLVHKALAEEPTNLELLQEIKRLEILVYECKELLTNQSEELDIMLSCYKEKQLLATSRLATTRNDKPITTVRANEICFKHAQWRLTEADGQLGIADLVLSNFLYTKNSRSDDSVEHLLELGYVRMTNLLPNQIYTEVLCPTEIQSTMPIDHKRVLRVFCRERPPVGGISVKEHFEINVVPITIGLTKKFFNTMLRFCFPERDPDNIEGETGEEIDENSRGKKTRTSVRKSKDTNFYVRIDPKDDVEKMKERAEKNKLFIYIKIPEVPVRVSYKGNKEKNIEDIRDFSLVIPTLEYHNVTWTWLDLLLAMKTDSRRVILSQAIKQKLQINRNRGSADESALPQEEDKARMLFGARHVPGDKSLKKGVTGVFKFHK